MPDKPEEKETETKKSGAQWEQREFGIYKTMKEVCELGVVVTKTEIASLKRKLEKLQYGS
jgi:hypothetical protein